METRKERKIRRENEVKRYEGDFIGRI